MELNMATLYLTEQNSLVQKDGDTLVVHLPANDKTGQPKRKVRVPLIKIDHVVVQGYSTLTSPAVAALMERQADVTFLNQYGRFQGYLAPAFSKNGQLRLAQAAAHHDLARRHHLARAFVAGKMANMRTMLLRANRKRNNDAIAQAAAAIRQNLDHAQALQPDSRPPDPRRPQADSAYGRLQGLEGSATAHYFNCFQYLLNEPALFSGRTRRPPRDPANALLSYGYTILLSQISSAIGAVGLDPYVGYLHSSQYGKPALALDLMEEFRPLVVDSVVLSVFNNGMIQAGDFIEEFGAYRLTGPGQRTFLTRLEARFDETITHPTFDYKATYRRCLELQARLLAKTLMGEIPAYPPFIVR
ncbi:MAG: type I-D CRISPR-associated endonuclease Cas1d [Chloroflexi bacterium]|nr:type I-D CRISPR-associated endonuclease Cas1d [Chloroflexota bacterium]MCI0649458.1 type I-D CRISPR-associated endonuclease Cas1d [Chloroflexota bacterium]MCI0731871.1 type I-D CRISPR-associated endonuclease Cas1d [Chloroflexota bacterium]